MVYRLLTSWRSLCFLLLVSERFDAAVLYQTAEDTVDSRVSATLSAQGAVQRVSVIRSNPWPRSRHHASEKELAADQNLRDDELVKHPTSGASLLQNASQVEPFAAGTNDTTAAVGSTVIKDKAAMNSVSTSLGVMLLGMVAFTMSLFYATHFPDSDVQHATWVTLSEAISLFSAVLLFTSFKEVMVMQFGERGGHHNGIPDIKSMILSFLRLLLVFWGMQFLLLRWRRSDMGLKAMGSVGGNLIAFAAIDSFGMIQQFEPFRDNPVYAFFGATIAAFMVLCMCLSASIVRKHINTFEDGVVKDHEKNWDEECKSMENQFSSICMGLLLSIVIRFSISGSLPAIWGSPRGKTQDQVNTLLGVSLGFAIPVFGLSLAVGALESHRGAIPGVVRAAKVTQLILSMSMGWSFVFCGQWQFWSATHGDGFGVGDKMTARMVNALVFSYLSFGFIIALDFLADRLQVARGGFEAVSKSFMLGLGISWQGAFSEATSALNQHYDNATSRAYMDILTTLCLLAIVLPAWLWYMLPKALAGPVPLNNAKDETDKAKETGDESADDARSDASVCQQCGAQLEEGAEFCQNCGTKRVAAAPSAPENASAAPAPKNGAVLSAPVAAASAAPAVAAPVVPAPEPAVATAPAVPFVATPEPATSSGKGGGGKAAEGKGSRGSIGKFSSVPGNSPAAEETFQVPAFGQNDDGLDEGDASF